MASPSPEPKPQPFALAVGQSVVLTPRGLDAAGKAYPLPWPPAWSTPAEKALRLEPLADGSARVTGLAPGAGAVTLKAGGLSLTFRVDVAPSPVVALAAVPDGPPVFADFSAGPWAYPGTAPSLAWQADRRGAAPGA